jgi:hypothetical protein
LVCFLMVVVPRILAAVAVGFWGVLLELKEDVQKETKGVWKKGTRD